MQNLVIGIMAIMLLTVIAAVGVDALMQPLPYESPAKTALRMGE